MAEIGQFFVVSALVVAVLMFSVLASYNQDSSNEVDATETILLESYFDSLPETFAKSSDSGLAPQQIVYKQDMYFNSSLRSRGIEFSAVHVIFEPASNHAHIVNYRQDQLTITLTDQNRNTVSLDPLQRRKISLADSNSYLVNSTDLELSRTVSNESRIVLTYARMVSDQSDLVSTRIQ